jgi:NAD(P)-dependent dehydrogenase (short-subunit alcohol dehydrogenase family)
MSTFPSERTAIVTGAVSERGIGRATANYLAEQGWNIGIIDLDDALCQATAKEIASQYGVKAHGVGANVADEASVRAAIDSIEAELPQIVALANVAGVSSPVPYLELDAAEWDRVLNINLNGVHYATRRVAESMVEEPDRPHREHLLRLRPARRGNLLQDPVLRGEGRRDRPDPFNGPRVGGVRHHRQRHLSRPHRH